MLRLELSPEEIEGLRRSAEQLSATLAEVKQES